MACYSGDQEQAKRLVIITDDDRERSCCAVGVLLLPRSSQFRFIFGVYFLVCPILWSFFFIQTKIRKFIPELWLAILKQKPLLK